MLWLLVTLRGSADDLLVPPGDGTGVKAEALERGVEQRLSHRDLGFSTLHAVSREL